MSNTGITLVDVRQEAMDAIRKLKSGDIDVKTAGAIKDLLNTVVDTAKTQVAYIQSIPNTIKEQMSVNEVKAIAGTLVDRDAELDNSLAEIRQNQKQVYKHKTPKLPYQTMQINPENPHISKNAPKKRK